MRIQVEATENTTACSRSPTERPAAAGHAVLVERDKTNIGRHDNQDTTIASRRAAAFRKTGMSCPQAMLLTAAADRNGKYPWEVVCDSHGFFLPLWLFSLYFASRLAWVWIVR